MTEKLARGEPVYLLGVTPFGHNSGAALVRASGDGVELIANHEEERFSGIKHCAHFPEQSIDAMLSQMRELGLGPDNIHAVLASWDYVSLAAHGFRLMGGEFPASLCWFRRSAQDSAMTIKMVTRSMFEAPSRVGRQLGGKQPGAMIGMRHHDNHAYLSYACSPFAARGDIEPVMIAVLDGAGDDGAISLYEARSGRVRMLFGNADAFDSLGMLYTLISSTQGGWTPLSSEGRFMGAAAWGDGDRLTNPYYMQLRQILYFGPNGQVRLNRAYANWQRRSWLEPYAPELTRILGPPIPREKLWNPDAVLDVEDIAESKVTGERVDKAAALQLVFEDALFHVIGHLTRETGSHRLILTGGCALNCVANMRLLERFDENWYARNLGKKDTRLHLWVPPVPGDAGAAAGAAFRFAMSCGAMPGAPLTHAFYCGRAAVGDEIRAALNRSEEIASLSLPDAASPKGRLLLADWMAYAVAGGAVIGIFQGAAETGPRALGHRSILADPRNPRMLELLNAVVKHRERVRPLAPMLTLEAARRFFELSPGAADADYGAYNYMSLTARARPDALAAIPAVIHRDGTGRIQIAREATDPLMYAYLKAMGRRAGVEVSVNTSLNVQGPIVQTPVQALDALKRSRGMDGIVFVSAGGEAFLVWHAVKRPPKDSGARLLGLLRSWQSETTAEPFEPLLQREALRPLPDRLPNVAPPVASLPPGPSHPAILQLASWGLRTARTMEECTRRYGDAFTLRFPGYPPQVFFSHPDAIRDIFTGDPEVFRAGESNMVLEPFVGSRSLLVLDGQRHLAERKLILSALHVDVMGGHVETMRSIAARAIDKWPTGKAFPIHSELQEIALEVIVHAVFGIGDGPAKAALRARLKRFLTIGSNRLLFFPRFQVDLGRFSPWGRLVRLKAEISAALAAEIASRRRRRDPDRRDVLSMLIAARGDDGHGLGDEELIDEMLTLLVVGHETTATALAWTFYNVARHEAVLTKVEEELGRVVNGSAVNSTHIPKLEYLDAVIKETLRLMPVLPVVGRVLAAPATIRDHTLPRGVYVNPCPYLTHRRADLWPEPARFSPERFLTTRPGPYEFLPFGGGVRRCVGMAFATYEMKVVLAEALSRLHLSLRPGYTGGIACRSITLAPRRGVPVIARPRRG